MSKTLNSTICLRVSVYMPDIAKELLEAAQVICRKAMKDFTGLHFDFRKYVGFQNPIKCNKLEKLLRLARSRRNLTSSQNEIGEMRAERKIFCQLVILSIEHNVDLKWTLSLPLGPGPWSLSTPDGMSTKPDKTKLLHFLESHIEPTVDLPSSAANITDRNAILRCLTAIPVTFGEQAESVFNQSRKAEHVGFVTDTNIQCISSTL